MILKEKKLIFNKGSEKKKHNLNQARVIRPKLPYRKSDIIKSWSKIFNYKNLKK